MAVTYLSFYLAHYPTEINPYIGTITVNGNIYVTQTIVAHGVKSGRNVIIMTLKNRY